jgi:hypothetical protein
VLISDDFFPAVRKGAAPLQCFGGTFPCRVGCLTEPFEGFDNEGENDMKHLMLTTAIVAVTSMGAVAQTADAPAQAPAATAQTGAQTDAQSQTVPAFMASEFTDKELYTMTSEDARSLRDMRATDGDRVRWENSTLFNEKRDSWENVGNISDIVVTQDGEVRGVLIDVGGFLGLGAQTVMIAMDELYFVTEDASAAAGDRYSLVVALTEDELKALPAWDEAQLTGFALRENARMQGQMSQKAVPIEADATRPVDNTSGMQDTAAYGDLPPEERTAARLTGASAYTPEGEDIATVEALLLDADGKATHLVMDVGGFLGIGSRKVAIDIEQVEIMWNDADNDVRIEVPMTEDQLNALPEYQEG